MLFALSQFLTMLHSLAVARGGADQDVLKLVQLGAIAARAGDTYQREIESRTAQMQTLIDEARGLTPEENAALDAEIETRLTGIGAIDLSGNGDGEDFPIG